MKKIIIRKDGEEVEVNQDGDVLVGGKNYNISFSNDGKINIDNICVENLSYEIKPKKLKFYNNSIEYENTDSDTKPSINHNTGSSYFSYDACVTCLTQEEINMISSVRLSLVMETNDDEDDKKETIDKAMIKFEKLLDFFMEKTEVKNFTLSISKKNYHVVTQCTISISNNVTTMDLINFDMVANYNYSYFLEKLETKYAKNPIQMTINPSTSGYKTYRNDPVETDLEPFGIDVISRIELFNCNFGSIERMYYFVDMLRNMPLIKSFSVRGEVYDFYEYDTDETVDYMIFINHDYDTGRKSYEVINCSPDILTDLVRLTSSLYIDNLEEIVILDENDEEISFFINPTTLVNDFERPIHFSRNILSCGDNISFYSYKGYGNFTDYEIFSDVEILNIIENEQGYKKDKYGQWYVGDKDCFISHDYYNGNMDYKEKVFYDVYNQIKSGATDIVATPIKNPAGNYYTPTISEKIWTDIIENNPQISSVSDGMFNYSRGNTLVVNSGGSSGLSAGDYSLAKIIEKADVEKISNSFNDLGDLGVTKVNDSVKEIENSIDLVKDADVFKKGNYLPAFKNLDKYAGRDISNGILPMFSTEDYYDNGIISSDKPYATYPYMQYLFGEEVDKKPTVMPIIKDADVIDSFLEEYTAPMKEIDKNFVEKIYEGAKYFNENVPPKYIFEVLDSGIDSMKKSIYSMFSGKKFTFYSYENFTLNSGVEVSDGWTDTVYSGLRLTDAERVPANLDIGISNEINADLVVLGTVSIELNEDGDAYEFISTVSEDLNGYTGHVAHILEKGEDGTAVYKETVSHDFSVVPYILDNGKVRYSLLSNEDGSLTITWANDTDLSPKFFQLGSKKVLVNTGQGV